MNRPYRWLAEYYDDLFTFHLGWAEAARQTILGGILPAVESACDLACGTGTTAIRLAKQGIRMYGVDLSPAMCRIARRKVRETGVPVRVVRGDMRDFVLPEPVDLVLCEFDALNHVPEKSDLARVARSVACALREGGHFFFDVNNQTAFERIWPGVWWLEKPGVVLVMRGGYDRAANRACTKAEWFLKEGRCWKRRQEHIDQVCWSAREIRRTLREAGFDRIRTWDATLFFKDDPFIVPRARTYYRARKRA